MPKKKGVAARKAYDKQPTQRAKEPTLKRETKLLRKGPEEKEILAFLLK